MRWTRSRDACRLEKQPLEGAKRDNENIPGADSRVCLLGQTRGQPLGQTALYMQPSRRCVRGIHTTTSELHVKQRTHKACVPMGPVGGLRGRDWDLLDNKGF